VTSAAEDEERAYTDLLTRHEAPVRAHARRLTGNRSLADDVFQETLLGAWRHRRLLVDRDGSVRSWLFAVVHNVAIDHLRGRRVGQLSDEAWERLPLTAADHADAVVTSAMVVPALRRLTAEQRHVIFELYYRRRTVTEAARAIGIPPGTVKSCAHYAVRALRDELTAAAA
jgi:RNA polymerase sigma-70 factor (ECF subfamily)